MDDPKRIYQGWLASFEDDPLSEREQELTWLAFDEAWSEGTEELAALRARLAESEAAREAERAEHAAFQAASRAREQALREALTWATDHLDETRAAGGTIMTEWLEWCDDQAKPALTARPDAGGEDNDG